jgi:hypothetical protein
VPPAADLRRGHVPARREPGGSGPERPQRAVAVHMDPTSGGTWMGLVGLIDGFSGLHR